MAQDQLGLFDTPPGRHDVRIAAACVGVLLAVFALVVPLSGIRLGEVVAFVPVTDAIIFVGELIIASLLYAQAAIFQSRALTMLASGFVYVALLLIPHALMFPGAFAHAGLFVTGTSGAAWAMIFRRMAFPLAIVLYAWFKRADSAAPQDATRGPGRVLVWLAGAIALAAATAALSIAGQDWLPPMFYDRSRAIPFNLMVFNLSNLVVIVLAMLALRSRHQSVLDMWLQVALCCWLMQTLMNMPLHARYTVGWYSLYGVMVCSLLIVLIALITESNRLYARLALTTAARERERDTRMMSMEAVAAAISHEIGQPLAAVALSASASLNCLTREPPDHAMAIKSLRDAIEAGNRTFEVLRSVRSTFGQLTDSLTEFSLTDLVLETVSLLDRELAAQRISLQLALDPGLPALLANRVQIQRVLVNLLANAVDSLSATRRRDRMISLRTSTPDDDNVLLVIGDNGVGIPADDIERIFDPFFTTKKTGTGLGLSLCRTIVEEHGGRLWASRPDGGGATFHLRLLRNPLPQPAPPANA